MCTRCLLSKFNCLTKTLVKCLCAQEKERQRFGTVRPCHILISQRKLIKLIQCSLQYNLDCKNSEK